MEELTRRVCTYCGAPLRELVDGACPFCRTRPFTADGSAPVGPPATAFAVVLLDAGAKKINVIKEIREQTDRDGDGLGLKEAKDLADAANPHTPPVLATGVDAQRAQQWAAALVAAGAHVEVRPVPAAGSSWTPPPVAGAPVTYGVFLVHCGKKKIQVIKEIREITGIGLKEAKDIADGADGAPQLVAGGLDEHDARAAATKLSLAGATAELRAG